MAKEKILVPVDFSEPSEHAVAMAEKMASVLGAELHLLHVYQLPAYTLPDGALLAGPDITAQIMDESKKSLDRMVRGSTERGIPAQAHLAEGLPHKEIEKAAEALGATLLVIGTHGRTGIAHLLIGSVAERVVRASKIPVLTVRPPKET